MVNEQKSIKLMELYMKKFLANNEKDRNSRNSGITLIALIISIIIILILTAVMINLIFRHDEINRSMQAVEEYKISEYIDRVEAARGSKTIEKLRRATLDELISQIYEDKIVSEGSIVKINEEKARMTTKEGYVFIITGDMVKYIGRDGIDIEKVPDLQEKDIEIIPEPNGITKENIKVTIKNNKDEKLTLQYSLDEKNWVEYKESFEISKNGTIYASLINIIGERTKVVKLEIKLIDKLSPKEFEPEIKVTSNSIEVNAGGASDREETEEYIKTGIGEIWYSIDGGEWKTNEEDKTKTTYTFAGLQQDSAHKIRVKVIDKVGNEIITEEKTVTTLKQIVTGISLNKTSTEIKAGNTEQLVVSILPADAYNKNVTWSSSNTGIVTVTSSGLIRGIAEGTATITVRAQDESGLSASCTVRVYPARMYLYNNGNEYTNLTGGWRCGPVSSKNNKRGSWGKAASWLWQINVVYGSDRLSTSNKIYIPNVYTNLCATVRCTTSSFDNGRLGLLNSWCDGQVENVRYSYNTSWTTKYLNIRGYVNGSYHVMVGTDNTQDNSHLNVNAVWFE